MTTFVDTSDVDGLAKYLYDFMYGDLDDTSGPFDLLSKLGYLDKNGEWIYEDDK